MSALSTKFLGILARTNHEAPDVLDLLFEYTDLLLALTEFDGTIMSQSRSFKRDFGRSEATPCRHFTELLNESSRFDYEKSLKYIEREGKPVRNLSVTLSARGKAGATLLTLIPLTHANGRNQKVLHLLHDSAAVSDARTDFAQIEKLTNVGQIAAGIAHELNTPLGSIVLSAGNILESAEDLETVEEVTRIKNRAEHCSSVVKELLGYVRRSEPGRQRFSLSSIVNKVLSLTSVECNKRDITVHTDSRDTDVELTCNVNQIEQVVFNLVDNAMYAIGERGRIDIGIRRDDMLGRVTVNVSDNGPGIPAERIERIFDPFYTTKPGAQGTGLGLAICKKIALEHGGDISVSSVDSEGTTFEMWLPNTDD